MRLIDAVYITLLIVWATYTIYFVNDIDTELRHIRWALEEQTERKEE